MHRCRALVLVSSLFSVVACGGDDGGGGDGNDSMVDVTGNADESGEAGEPATECDFEESFDGSGGSWPSRWRRLGGVATADVVDGRARLLPTPGPYAVARMYAPLDCTDAEVTFAFEFGDASSQGLGFYVRQNAGYLEMTNPRGRGYSTFVENFRSPVGIGVWREVDGVEQALEPIVPVPVEPGVVYRARLRVTQQNAGTTQLQARMWRDGESEPSAWQVERTDTTAGLQGRGGGIAIDTYTTRTSGSAADLFIDDVVVTAAR